MWDHMNSYHGSWGGIGFGMIGMSLFWILLIAVIIALLRGLWGSSGSLGRRQETTALDILKARYARGEIEKAEFELKKRDLSD